MLLLAEPRLSPPYPLARTFAPPPHFRPHHNRIFSDLHLKTEKEYNTGKDRVTGKRMRLYREICHQPEEWVSSGVREWVIFRINRNGCQCR